ncbi:MAG TPA: hypothetical protein PKZ07_16120 [Sedimentisphaerales bacterium]|nr:hypothetical protein [Sedimentisphaerales bacterium]
MFQQWVTEALGGQVRTAIAAVFGYLVLKGWMTPEMGTTFTTDATTRALQYLGVITPAAWSAYSKYRVRILALARTQLGSAATEEQVRLKALQLGFSDLWQHAPQRDALHRQVIDLKARLAMVEARLHDLEATWKPPTQS